MVHNIEILHNTKCNYNTDYTLKRAYDYLYVLRSDKGLAIGALGVVKEHDGYISADVWFRRGRLDTGFIYWGMEQHIGNTCFVTILQHDLPTRMLVNNLGFTKCGCGTKMNIYKKQL